MDSHRNGEITPDVLQGPCPTTARPAPALGGPPCALGGPPCALQMPPLLPMMNRTPNETPYAYVFSASFAS